MGQFRRCADGCGDRLARHCLLRRFAAAKLRRIGTPVEYHKYPSVGHGFGTGQGTSAQGWIGEAVRFWEKEIKKTP